MQNKGMLIFLFCFSFMTELFAQTGLEATLVERNYSIDSVSIDSGNEVVYTPFGPAIKSNVHYVDRDHHLKFCNNTIQVIQNVTGKIREEFDVTGNEGHYKKLKNEYIKSEVSSFIAENDSDDGWISFAVGQDYYEISGPISHYSATWNVPSPPNCKSDQLIYLFIALEGSSILENGNSNFHIVQPVLQWGLSPAGGGKYWAICNWHVTNENQFFYDSLIKVNSGAILEGVIELTSSTEGQYSYRSYFAGYDMGLQATNLPELNTLYAALEAYNVYSCNEYPADEKVRMKNINIMTGNTYPKILWFPSQEFKDPVNDCNQFTEIVDGNSQGGAIDIHFHTPSPINNFEEIHIFPNPAGDYLNISPKRPILNCRIEIINNSGRKIYSNFFENFDYELDIDFSSYPPGMYYIRFSYYDSIYSLKASRESNHTFKVIKR